MEEVMFEELIQGTKAEIPVEIEFISKDGEKKVAVLKLKPLSIGELKKLRSLALARAKTEARGNPSLKDRIDELQTEYFLYLKVAKSLIPERSVEEIMQLPEMVFNKLLDKVNEISGLDEETIKKLLSLQKAT